MAKQILDNKEERLHEVTLIEVSDCHHGIVKYEKDIPICQKCKERCLPVELLVEDRR